MVILRNVVLVALGSAVVSAEDWPQWRGPGSQGVSRETSIPSAWTPDTNIAWKAPVPGRGHSAPVVWRDRVFLTTAVEGEPVQGAKAVEHMDSGKPWLHPDSIGADRKHTYKVMALNGRTGNLLWEHDAWEGVAFDNRHRKGSFASPSVVTDGRHVFAYFGAEGVFAYDVDGRALWKTSVGKLKTFGLGAGSSPVIYDDLVILQCDEDEGKDSAIVALEAATGRERWRTARRVQLSWSTPVLVRANGRMELVANGNESIIAYDPSSGRELWRAKGVGNHAIHTPMVGDGLVIVSAGHPGKKVIAIAAGGSGDITGTPRILWTYEKGTAYVASPILYEGQVYLLTDNGVITALDAKTGAVRYEGGRVPVPASFTGSPIAVNGNILLTSEDGDTFIIRAGAKYEVIAKSSVGEPVFTTLAISNGRIYIRGERHLFAIGK
jgi:outer membrane protein assembly factor BamB